MKVTIATLSDTVFTLEVASDMEVEHFKAFWFLAVEIGIGYISWSQVENFKALCEVESGIPAAEMVLLFNGQVVPCLESWWWNDWNHYGGPPSVVAVPCLESSGTIFISSRCLGTRRVWRRLGLGMETWWCWTGNYNWIGPFTAFPCTWNILLLQGGVKQHQGLGQEQDQQVQLQEEQRGREAGCLTSARFRFLQIFWQVWYASKDGTWFMCIRRFRQRRKLNCTPSKGKAGRGGSGHHQVVTQFLPFILLAVT